MLTYGAVATAAYLAAYLLRFELRWPSRFATTVLATLPLLVIIRVTFYRAFKLSTGRWRFVSVPDVLRLVGASSAGTLVFGAIEGTANPFLLSTDDVEKLRVELLDPE